jgi:hypothetical protein
MSAMAAVILGILLAFPVLANADALKMKDGQIHKGVITAEEPGRVQLRLEGSGVRVWFSRDQILSIENVGENQEEEGSSGQSTESEEPVADDEVARARELLRKIREQSSSPKKEAKEDKTSEPAKQALSAEPAVTTATQTDPEIEKQIGILRNGQIYAQLNACSRLAELNAEDAIPDLIHALDSDSYALRNAANRALIKITGKDFGFDPKQHRRSRAPFVEKWRDWNEAERRKEAKEQFKSLW